MAAIRDANSPLWRRRLKTASFRGVSFHVDQQGQTGGRRLVSHEYPKRDLPFTEDMGRRVLRYQMVGYLIQKPFTSRAPSTNPASGQSVQNIINRNRFLQQINMSADYSLQRDRLRAALNAKGPAVLIDPYNPDMNHLNYGGEQLLFHCERYVCTEVRERGGYAQFEMSFVEAGIPGNTLPNDSTAQIVQNSSDAVDFGVVRFLDKNLEMFTQEDVKIGDVTIGP